MERILQAPFPEQSQSRAVTISSASPLSKTHQVKPAP